MARLAARSAPSTMMEEWSLMAANIGRTWAKAVDFIISGEKRFYRHIILNEQF
jgi:hypothetical protein